MKRPRFTIPELDAIIDALEFALAGEISGGPFDPWTEDGPKEGSTEWDKLASLRVRAARSASDKAKEIAANRRASW